MRSMAKEFQRSKRAVIKRKIQPTGFLQILNDRIPWTYDPFTIIDELHEQNFSGKSHFHQRIY